jgi:hypothetical protein
MDGTLQASAARQREAGKRIREFFTLVRRQTRELGIVEPKHLAATVTQFAADAEAAFVAAESAAKQGEPAHLEPLRETMRAHRNTLGMRRALLPLVEGEILAAPLFTPQRLPPATGESGNDAAHSDDFASVRWFGRNYEFTPNQAACVKILWANWQRGTPAVRGETVLENADVSQTRLDMVFRDNPAWGGMIAGGKVRGTYRLQPPK